LLLKDTVRALPNPYRQVLWLRCVLNVPQSELARRFGVGQPQISKWEKRGKQLLREELSSC
jgi:DNA-directed RNA polymerase specialized sigma24 family protein